MYGVFVAFLTDITNNAKLKLAGIALKRSKMRRKHHKFRQGHKVKKSDVFLLLIFTPLTTIQTLTIFLLRNNDSRP